MTDVEDLLDRVRWLITELDDVRATAQRLQHVLEMQAETTNATGKPRTAPVAANSTIWAPTDTPPPARPSDRLTTEDWLQRRGNILLACPSAEGLDSQAGL